MEGNGLTQECVKGHGRAQEAAEGHEPSQNTVEGYQPGRHPGIELEGQGLLLANSGSGGLEGQALVGHRGLGEQLMDMQWGLEGQVFESPACARSGPNWKSCAAARRSRMRRALGIGASLKKLIPACNEQGEPGSTDAAAVLGAASRAASGTSAMCTSLAAGARRLCRQRGRESSRSFIWGW